MFRSSLKLVLIGTIVAVAFTAFAPQADAFHRGWGYYGSTWGCGYSACYTPCYPTCYTPCYRTCYTPRYAVYSPYVSVYPRYRHVSYRRAYRWGYGGIGCCGTACSTGCNCTATSTCCGATGGVSNGPISNEPTPAVAPGNNVPTPATIDEGPVPVPEEATEPVIPPQTTTATPDNSGLLTIWVPYDAKVTVNGMATRSKGSRRQYVSYGLKPGFSYTYEVRAEVVREGKDGKPTIMEDSRKITITAGQRSSVAFGFNVTPNQDLAAGW